MKDVKTHVKSIILVLVIKNVLYQIRCQQEQSHVFARTGPYFLRREIVKKVNSIFDDSNHIFVYSKIIDQNDLGCTKYIYNLIVEVRPECYVDDDCGYSDICYKGSCADACRLSQCGANAKCESSLHSAKCLCLPGYTGNPRSACTLCKSSNYFYRIGKPIVFYVFFYSMSFCMNTPKACFQL